MSSSLRRGVLAAAVFAFPIASLTACGAGFDAETSKVEPDTSSAHVENIKIQNVTIIIPHDDDSLASITARLHNSGTKDQTVEAIRLPGTGKRVELTPAKGESEVVVPAGGSVALGGEGNASAVIEEPTEAGVNPGDAQRVVFDLSKTGGIGLDASVVDDGEGREYYADYAPTPTATASPSPTEETTAAGTSGQEDAGETTADATSSETPAGDETTAESEAGAESGEE